MPITNNYPVNKYNFVEHDKAPYQLNQSSHSNSDNDSLAGDLFRGGLNVAGSFLSDSFNIRLGLWSGREFRNGNYLPVALLSTGNNSAFLASATNSTSFSGIMKDVGKTEGMIGLVILCVVAAGAAVYCAYSAIKKISRDQKDHQNKVHFNRESRNQEELYQSNKNITKTMFDETAKESGVGAENLENFINQTSKIHGIGLLVKVITSQGLKNGENYNQINSKIDQELSKHQITPELQKIVNNFKTQIRNNFNKPIEAIEEIINKQVTNEIENKAADLAKNGNVSKEQLFSAQKNLEASVGKVKAIGNFVEASNAVFTAFKNSKQLTSQHLKEFLTDIGGRAPQNATKENLLELISNRTKHLVVNIADPEFTHENQQNYSNLMEHAQKLYENKFIQAKHNLVDEQGVNIIRGLVAMVKNFVSKIMGNAKQETIFNNIGLKSFLENKQESLKEFSSAMKNTDGINSNAEKIINKMKSNSTISFSTKNSGNTSLPNFKSNPIQAR